MSATSTLPLVDFILLRRPSAFLNAGVTTLAIAALVLFQMPTAGAVGAEVPAITVAPAQPQPGATRISPQQLADLFAQVDGDASPGSAASTPEISEFSQTDSNWPILVYLVGEIHLRHGDFDQARSAFRNLATWAAAGDAGRGSDGWGGSGLAAVALWRWLGILYERGNESQDLDRVLNSDAALRSTRLFGGMVGSGLLPALPLLEEDIARRLTRVASAAGRPEAKSLFLNFVSINSTGELEAADKAIVDKMIAEGNVTKERLDLFRYQRLLSRVTVLARKAEAAEHLEQLSKDANAPSDVRAEASYEWGNFYRSSKSRKPQVVAALTDAYESDRREGPVAEKALFRRAMVQSSVDPKRADLFYADLEQLLAGYPKSRLADDALYQIATEQLFGLPADTDRAFATFEKLRTFSGSNKWLDSAYFLPAIGHVDRGRDTDLQAADQLLNEYVNRYPEGVFRGRCLFWRGRIAERKQDARAARRLFQQVVDEVPFGYYGLRARLHLEFGGAAAQMPLPRPNSDAFAALHAAFQQSKVDADLTGQTPYHERLRTSEASGLYRRALSIVNGLGPKFRNRLDNISLQKLDEHRLIPAIAVLLSLRQDALAARDAEPTADNQLRLAGFAGRRLGDWPAAMLTVTNESSRPHTAFMTQLQTDPRYLATSYPGMADVPVLRQPLVKAAWPIHGSTALAKSLMYATIRRESAYFPGAISSAGAIGLFQILPATFENRKNCWDQQTVVAPPIPAAYLFNPDQNVQFWSCWIRKEFDPKKRTDLARLILFHNAGIGNLEEWEASWRGRAIEKDFELQIEAVRFPATQNFTRHVLTDAAIAESSGLFDTETLGQEQTP